jgi:NAD(P)-dependent dehydrogenase (short-subunit alcohol dehydrogenase family)
MTDPSNKVAVITGAGTGIGKAISLSLLRLGHRVVLAGIDRGPLEQALNEAGPNATNGLAMQADISDQLLVAALFAETRRRFDRLDILVNNAGIVEQPANLEDLDPAQWRAVMEVNVTGAFLCTQEAFRIMKTQVPRGGRIINIGSISAHAPRPNQVAYTASKHAITGLTKATSLEGRKHDIACGQIDLGNAATRLASQVTRGMPQANGEIAVEPLMDVEYVVKSVLYMASLPLEANVQFLTVMPTKMPFIGRG